MRILHTISGFGAKSGGTSTCTYDLLTGLRESQCSVDLLSLASKDPLDRLMGGGEDWIKVLPSDAKTPFGYSTNLKHFLCKEKEYSIYHTNGLWMYCNHITCSVARKKGKPYIITPHGMLYPQALSRSAWKKKIMRFLLFNKDLIHAACIHVTCTEEMLYYKKLGYENPVAIIPNPVSVPDFITSIQGDRSKKRIGFLGRLHPRKNVERLIDAWASLKEMNQNAELLIMGEGEPEYENFLKKKVKILGLLNVNFVGFVTGRNKFEKLASLSALCVPSDFENFGMIIPEALIMETPVIASKGTPWQELELHHCGWWIDNDVDTLIFTMKEALSLSEEKRLSMGMRGKELIEEKYSVEVVAKKMRRLYNWIIEGGEKPEFIY